MTRSALCTLLAVAGLTSSLTLLPVGVSKYDCNYVETLIVPYQTDRFQVIAMKRTNDHIKAKYFAAPDAQKTPVYSRYLRWAAGKNIILTTSGTYMDRSNKPVGLTIDNGAVVTNKLNNSDGLVTLFASGGLIVNNLKTEDPEVLVNGVKKQYHIKSSALDLLKYTEWAAQEKATVFQTHLLVFQNKLQIFENSSTKMAERRFLASGKDAQGERYHVVVQCPSKGLTLLEGSRKALNFLNEVQNLEVTFMINLDTGKQDVFKVYDCNGTENQNIKGALDIKDAANLLTYYFE